MNAMQQPLVLRLPARRPSRRLPRAKAVALTVVALIACSTEAPPHQAEAMFRGGPDHTGVYPGGGVTAYAGLRWAFDAGAPVRGGATVAGGVVFVGSTHGVLYALGAEDGRELWRTDVGSSVGSTPAVAGGMVIFGDRAGVLHALDRDDGSPRWAFSTGEEMPLPWGNEGWDYITSSPAVVDGVVLFGSGDGNLYALDVETGTERWRYATEGRIRSSPAVADGAVYVGSMDGSLHAVDLEAGAQRWRHDTEGRSLVSADFGFDRRSIQSSPAVAEGTVVFGSRDGHVYAVESETGALRWRFDHEVSWVVTSPAVDGGVVYGGSSDGLFAHALDLSTGDELWRTDTGARVFASLAVTDGAVVVADHAGFVRALDPGSGAELWQFRTGGAIQASPVVRDGTVYVGSEDGLVYALGGTPGPSLRRAVFWDGSMQPLYAGHEELKDDLEAAGYETLDAASLSGFMASRIEDGDASVVVVAMGDLPGEVAREAADTVLFRRYLEAGGRVVWLGYPPLALIRDAESGRITGVDPARTTSVLGVDHTRATFDEYATRVAAEGRGFGLRGSWIDIAGVDPADVDDVLALDERGRATSWVKRYGGGGAFVKLWGRANDAWADTDAVRRVAERTRR